MLAGEPLVAKQRWTQFATGPADPPADVARYLRAKLDDQLGLHRDRDVHRPRAVAQHAPFGNRRLRPATRKSGTVAMVLGQVGLHRLQALGAVLDADHVARLAPGSWGCSTRWPLTVMWPCAHQLPGLGAALAEAQPMHDVVQPPLEQAHQRVAGVALAARGFAESSRGTAAPARRSNASPSAFRASAGRSRSACRGDTGACPAPYRGARWRTWACRSACP